MVFSSSLFLLYFLPFFLIVYLLLPRSLKNFFVLLVSIAFYGWGAPVLVFMVLASLIIDFYLVAALDRSSRPRKRLLLGFSVVLNIGLLLYFKYANFFVDNINLILNNFGFEKVSWTKVALPIGISFFTFQKLTYSVDVYRKVHAPLKSLVDYMMYILMFPQLIAGPIVRYHEIADQIEDRRANENIDNRLTGFFRFVVGLSKKVLIANVLGEQVDKIFALEESALTPQLAWIGIIAYAFQIYYDFSGYSDMAIGLGRMIGFDFPENFNNPYISRSISEFWRRWHITLGRFMRDYLYIPLGGNRVQTVRRLYFNLALVFIISGFWHGAAWNFVVWGAFHGLFLILDRLFLLKLLDKIGKYPSIIFTFFITLIGWVLFRAESLSAAWVYLKAMFVHTGNISLVNLDREFWTILIIAGIFAFWGMLPKIENWQAWIYSKDQRSRNILIMSLLSILFFIISLAAITTSGFNPFIYFRF